MDSSSSSCSSGLSYQSSSSREPTPEFEVAAMNDAIAPLWWDEADWDFAAQSEDDESKTDGRTTSSSSSTRNWRRRATTT